MGDGGKYPRESHEIVKSVTFLATLIFIVDKIGLFWKWMPFFTFTARQDETTSNLKLLWIIHLSARV
jgi:hypothetical protein